MKKFTFNWGHGMVLVLLAFIIFILSFFYRYYAADGSNKDLVDEDYYNKGLLYQEKMLALENTKNLKVKPTIKAENETLYIQFPDSIQVTEGKVDIYRPSDKNLDRHLPLTLRSREMTIPKNFFKKGFYDISVSWKDASGKNYLLKNSVHWIW